MISVRVIQSRKECRNEIAESTDLSIRHAQSRVLNGDGVCHNRGGCQVTERKREMKH